MRHLGTAALTAAFATATLLGGAPAIAKDHGHGHDPSSYSRHASSTHRATTYRAGNGGYWSNGQWYANGQGPYPNGYNGNGTYGGPHGCTNPAGHTRGWCKNGNNGYNNGGNGGYGNTTSIRGVITSISGSNVTLLQGLTHTVSVNDQQALNNGRAGSLYVGKTVTAYGYWSGGTFYATSIA